jgi:hypothetical protein
MSTTPVSDYRGQLLFRCSRCDAPLTSDDFFALGMRLPDDGESCEEYREAELLDTAVHVDCMRVQIAV